MKFYILVTTALLSIPVLSDARPSGSYSHSSGSVGGGSSRSISSRSVSTYSSNSVSSRSTMNRIGGNVSSGWMNRTSQNTAYQKPNPVIANTQPTYQPPVQPSAPQPSSNGFISSLAGSYIGTRLANEDSHSSAPVQNQPTVSSPSQTPQAAQSLPTSRNTPITEEDSNGSTVLLWMLALLAGSAVIAGLVWYFVFYKPKQTVETEKEKELFYPGMNVTVVPAILETDPKSKNCPLHFEADNSGTCTVIAVSEMAECWHLYLDSDMNEFVRVITSNGKIVEARFFSYINQYPIGTDEDMDNWLGSNGLIGSQIYETEDNVNWTREIFSTSENRIDPPTDIEDVKTLNSHAVWKNISCMYSRNTGFDEAYAQEEYLLVSFLKGYDDNGEPVSFVKVFAGIDLPVASLNLVC